MEKKREREEEREGRSNKGDRRVTERERTWPEGGGGG